MRLTENLEAGSSVEATISRSVGDEDITVSPALISFDATNWDQWQTITVAAAQDSYGARGTATLFISGESFSPLSISVVEEDDEYAQYCDSVTSIPIAECEALKGLYDSTGGDNWTNNTGWLENQNPCSWFGINCVSGSVDSISLYSNNISGVLPAELGNLPK